MPPRGTNSSKTEHVMNLLRKSGSAETPRQAVAEENATAAASASRATPRNKLPILTALNADVEVSSKIKDALESALLIEEVSPSPVATLDMYADTDEPVIPAPTPKAPPTPVEVAAPVSQSAPIAVASIVTESVKLGSVEYTNLREFHVAVTVPLTNSTLESGSV